MDNSKLCHIVHVEFTGKAQLLVKCLSVNVSNILIIYNFTRINHSRGRKELFTAMFSKNQRMNGPVNTHLISGPSLSTKHKKDSNV